MRSRANVYKRDFASTMSELCNYVVMGAIFATFFGVVGKVILDDVRNKAPATPPAASTAAAKPPTLDQHLKNTAQKGKKTTPAAVSSEQSVRRLVVMEGKAVESQAGAPPAPAKSAPAKGKNGLPVLDAAAVKQAQILIGLTLDESRVKPYEKEFTAKAKLGFKRVIDLGLMPIFELASKLSGVDTIDLITIACLESDVKLRMKNPGSADGITQYLSGGCFESIARYGASLAKNMIPHSKEDGQALADIARFITQDKKTGEIVLQHAEYKVFMEETYKIKDADLWKDALALRKRDLVCLSLTGCDVKAKNAALESAVGPCNRGYKWGVHFLGLAGIMGGINAGYGQARMEQAFSADALTGNKIPPKALIADGLLAKVFIPYRIISREVEGLATEYKLVQIAKPTTPPANSAKVASAPGPRNG